MRHQISKKILLYIFFLVLFGTLTNKNLKNFEFPKINSIEITGFDENENNLLKNIEYLRLRNLFFLSKNEISEILNSYHLIEKYSIFKQYPSSLKIKIKKTDFLANVQKEGKIFYYGSNGKFIETDKFLSDIPFIFGSFDRNQFFILKKIIDNSNLNYSEIKNMFSFPSGRWDIETNSGILIRLPKNNLKESFNFSVNLLNDKDFKNIKLIDLRQNNQIILNDR